MTAVQHGQRRAQEVGETRRLLDRPHGVEPPVHDLDRHGPQRRETGSEVEGGPPLDAEGVGERRGAHLGRWRRRERAVEDPLGQGGRPRRADGAQDRPHVAVLVHVRAGVDEDEPGDDVGVGECEFLRQDTPCEVADHDGRFAARSREMALLVWPPAPKRPARPSRATRPGRRRRSTNPRSRRRV
ncbi:hypothetical protein [Frondihabitans sp. PhB188]|uniref:hypothetical protein n=1 Tax=Frondihabitans sp. PhB188 TaxID=2485200 RepID=UPI0011CD9AA8|nr:hypothetical protein [Frondihabitans sp. PhB188]